MARAHTRVCVGVCGSVCVAVCVAVRVTVGGNGWQWVAVCVCGSASVCDVRVCVWKCVEVCGSVWKCESDCVLWLNISINMQYQPSEVASSRSRVTR